MKRLLYGLAVVLALVTAVGYTLGGRWQLNQLQKKEELTDAQRVRQLKARAQNGDAIAQYQLGYRYEKGRGVKTDYRQAAQWYGKAARFAQQRDAQYRLAQLYFNGRGVENDMATAMELFKKAAYQGQASAQFFMGVANRDGWEKSRDFKEAYMWFLLAQKKADEVRAENPRYDPDMMLAELDQRMSKFDRDEALKRAQAWRPK